jgi:polyisoprenoid-binding protein YceI
MRSLTLAVLFLATAAAADTYSIDRKKSELVVKTWKQGFASALAHNHVVQATDVAGELTWDPAAPEATKVSVTVQVSGLVADKTEARKRHGQPNEISAADQKKVTDAMLGEDQLDLRKFQTITFVSTGMEKGNVIAGKFTMHGVTREVKVPVKIEEKDGAVIGSGSFKLRVSDYKIQPYSTALGAIKNQDEVEIVLQLVGVKGK